MAQELINQLFSEPAPKREQKKDSNPDILNSLFTMQAPVSTKNTGSSLKKRKSEEELNEYISRMASKNKDKYSRDMQRLKDQRTLSPGMLKQKREVEKSMEKSLTAKNRQSQFNLPSVRKENKYMPTIVDPFAKNKPEEKVEPVAGSKYKEKTSKVQSKNLKI